MKHKTSLFSSQTLAVLLVGAVFALCLMLVLLTGAEGYASLVRRGEEGYRQRTVAQYITTRVRQAPNGGSVTVGQFHGAPALEVREELEGDWYLTRVYCHEGYLRELFTPEGGNFSPEDGEKLLPLEEITFVETGSALNVTLSWEDGARQTVTLHLPGKEVLP